VRLHRVRGASTSRPAVELLHTATLLHDDVVDLSELARGRPSANALWGNRRAVLAGDFFYARASSLIVEDGDLDILWIFADAIRSMAEGELLQLQRSFDPSVTEAHYFQVIERKSAVLLSAACESGSILGGVTRASGAGSPSTAASSARVPAARRRARLRDREADLGKRPYGDLREGKVTLPLLLALKRCTPAEREAVASLLKSVSRKRRARDARSSISRPRSRWCGRYRGVEDTGAPRRRARAPRAHRDRSLPRWRRPERPARRCRVRRHARPLAAFVSPPESVPGVTPMVRFVSIASAALALTTLLVTAAVPVWAEGKITGVVNVNTASASELEMLPGIGASRAKAVIEAREAKGGFKSLDDLLAVKGIGEASLAKLRPHLTLEGKTTAHPE
jgi:competence ComEA-like helix-hairpin-helix protein